MSASTSGTSDSVTWTTDLASAVRHVRTLHELDWQWTRTHVESLVDAHADWKIRREFADLLVVGLEPSRGVGGSLGPELHLDKREPKASDFVRAKLRLLEFRLPTPAEERERALGELSAALAEIGSPTPVPAAADGHGLRWQSKEWTMLLHSNDRWAWIALQPVLQPSQARHTGPETAELITASVPPLYDAPAPDATDHLRLYAFEEAPSLDRRRDVFGEVYSAVRGVIGEPTIYGGGPTGPDVRWRTAGEDARLLRLRADRRSVWIETSPAAEVEDEELATFEHGGPTGGPDGPSDFPLLPYSWQLVLYGPGDTATYLPGGRLALNLPHLREALETLLRAWIEQLPVQRPGEKVTFSIAGTLISGGLSFTYDTVKGVLLRIGSRAGDPEEVAAAMTAAGWQPAGRRWKAEYKQPTEETASEVATLITTELAARAVTSPHHGTTARRPGLGTGSHGPHGFFRATGLGLESS
ncbi:hypothetical protein ACFYWX_07970 [Streptomyces sp. NPDC002888]|uniref:hypothetical protein n=1 Tax=Streptomyces sp. NPDC002888 TaxID=3364668 RepID=UPI0036AECF0B